ncbi:hypothetical protein ACJJTC_000094, partial [Scirpophaga incertulas]
MLIVIHVPTEEHSRNPRETAAGDDDLDDLRKPSSQPNAGLPRIVGLLAVSPNLTMLIVIHVPAEEHSRNPRETAAGDDDLDDLRRSSSRPNAGLPRTVGLLAVISPNLTILIVIHVPAEGHSRNPRETAAGDDDLDDLRRPSSQPNAGLPRTVDFL